MIERKKELVTKATLEAINEDVGFNKATKDGKKHAEQKTSDEIVMPKIAIPEAKQLFRVVHNKPPAEKGFKLRTFKIGK